MSRAPEPLPLAGPLLATSPEERAATLASMDDASLMDLVAALGHLRSQDAATLLAEIDAGPADRTVRKAARTELHRLRGIGVRPPDRELPADPAPRRAAPRGPEAQPTEAWATDIGPTGVRVVTLFGERSLGGAWLGWFILNDQDGLVDCVISDTTRKRFQKLLASVQEDEGATWITLPAAYAQQLVAESVELSRGHQQPLPANYVHYRPALGEAEHGPERALVYESISPLAGTFNPTWLQLSLRVTLEKEAMTWVVPAPADLHDRALDVARATSSALLVPGNEPNDQLRRLAMDVARQALTPEFRHALKRRFEETAYMFVATDRLALAGYLVAAAVAVADPAVGLDRMPLIQVMLARGLSQLLVDDVVGSRPAYEVMYERFEAAFASGAEPAPMTSPGGLILPR